MKTYNFKPTIEDLISRVPSMFAYLEFNEDWTTTLHPATDSYNGSYGKIVENIAIPCGVWLTLYAEIPEVPEGYVFNNGNTYPSETDMETNFPAYSDKYARRLEQCWYEESEFDDSIEYTEYQDVPNNPDYNSPDYIKVQQTDSDGQPITDCQGNGFYKYYTKECEYSFYEKECFVSEGETYTYRTLSDYYYRFKEKLGESNNFIKFMDRGFGKVYTDKTVLHLEDENIYPNVPDYVYLGNVRSLIEKYEKYHRICEYYKTHFTLFGESNEKLDEKCRLYETMGGEKFLAYLKKLLTKCNGIASEYLCYANNRSHDVQLSFSLPMVQSHNDLGYLSSYMNEFVPGQQYYHGELLTYEGRTYICILNRFLPGGDNYQYTLCNGKLFKLVSNSYEEVSVGEIPFDTIPSYIYENMACIVYMGEYYTWDGAAYNNIDVTKYTTGFWDDTEKKIKFDRQHFVLLSDYIAQDSTMLSMPEKNILKENDKWYYDKNTYGDGFKLFVEVPYLPKEFIYPNIKCEETYYFWDKDLSMYVLDDRTSTEYEINGVSESILTTLRSYGQYMDANGLIRYPDPTEDWLFYYKIGNFNANGTILWDEKGNIKRFNENTIRPGEYASDLIAYGTILTNITCDTEAKTLTFTYVVNGHLKAMLKNINVDNDGNNLYCYGPFEYDSNDSHGIIHTEVYSYNDADIDELVSNGDFDAYVEGRVDDIQSFMTKYGFKKFAFDTGSALSTVSVGEYSYDRPSVLSEYSETVENVLDYIYQPVFKKDYFVGYSYEPTVEASIDIKRGNAASYERHVKLGEYRTLEDLSSSGFYSFSE